MLETVPSPSQVSVYSNIYGDSDRHYDFFLAPPSDPVASPANCTLDSVTLQWNGSLFDGGSNLTNYTLTSSPPTPNCNGSCAVAPTSRQYTFSGLQPGVPYTLGVSGTNCGGTQQGAQNNISVTIPCGWTPYYFLMYHTLSWGCVKVYCMRIAIEWLHFDVN